MSVMGSQTGRDDSVAEFLIRYWGVTGSFPNPLRPRQVTEKLADSLAFLHDRGELKSLLAGKPDRDELLERLERVLPFSLRSTYGGNTTCFEIQAGRETIIIDAGSGLRNLGTELANRWEAQGRQARRVAHLVLTHCHMDHTFAIPFAAPFFDPRNHFTVWASQRVLDSLDRLFKPGRELNGTFFPTTYEMLAGLKAFRQIDEEKSFNIEHVEFKPFALNHPGNALGFVVSANNRRLVFASDHEHDCVPDERLANIAAGADLLYLDAQYYDDEYQGREGIGPAPKMPRVGWGHSTLEASVATAIVANVKRLHLGHHEPLRVDADLSRMEAHARTMLQKFGSRSGPDNAHGMSADELQPTCIQAAYEGMSFEI